MREEQLIAEILHDKNLGADVSAELALYLLAQTRYITALAHRKELEIADVLATSVEEYTSRELRDLVDIKAAVENKAALKRIEEKKREKAQTHGDMPW